MAEFSKLYLTKRGQALVAKIMAGATNIQFTKVSTSSKVYAESALEALTALENVQQTNNVTKVTISNNTSVRVETAFTNEKLTAGYYLRCLGLYAKDPDLGEILYAVCVETSGLCYMPAYNGVTVSSAYIQLYTTVGNSDNVNLAVYSGAYATVEDISALEAEIADLRAYVGYTDGDIYGVEVDFANKKFTRLAGAVGMAGGEPFDKVRAMGGRKRCNLTDDGVVVAYQGDPAFSSSGVLTQAATVGDTTYPVGTKVQVMVEQPKFYYKVVPMVLERTSDTADQGWKTRKVRYYISDTPKAGFKVHPQFICNGKENDYIYKSAYEGCLWDKSAAAYIMDDAQVADFANDMLSSIANAQPASGKTQNLTRANTRKLAQNRGHGWEQQYAAVLAGTQLLMLIEYGNFNSQNNIGAGVTNKPWLEDGVNYSELTGATVNLGNASGAVTNANGYNVVSYRGEENLWGNIWKWEDGLNIKNPSTFAADDGQVGVLYAADHGFTDDTGAAPYEDTGIRVPYINWSYISAFGYSESYDWLFVGVEGKGNSSVPVGDCVSNVNPGWHVARSGAYWNNGASAGVFCLSLYHSAGDRNRIISGRSVYIPSRKKELDEAA
ncbi:MAG: hypothetical protein PUF15_05410 [Faecalibacterium prausnitzii]|nr:hypothetical protein [Faecalibacterium prausnitzii]